MRKPTVCVVFLICAIIMGCSGGANNLVSPNIQSNDQEKGFQITDASDVLYQRGSDQAYKAFGIFQIVLDPESLTAEIIPSRKSQAIGMTFDSDLTQFLTVSPCANCLQVNGIKFIPSNQVEVGFAVKHPFADITKRPDLHGFDVRGIVLAKGNWNFPLTQVALDASTNVAARANVSLLANPDGYTHHFDELASDPHYFDPPRDYNANINPFRRYFVDGTTPTFDPHSPSGHNVMKVGANWEIQKYVFNVGTGTETIDFAFVVDCAYGQSATFQNRTNPYYFLPEFNRKEAWFVGSSVLGGTLQSGNTSSSVNIKVAVSDWQAGLAADPAYPNISNLGGIKAKSDVAKVSIEIPSVSGLVEKATPDSGAGTDANPYVYTVNVTNSKGALAGWYYGIVAVRDDLQGQQGPMAIPETPAGFPYAGPEIYDYSSYAIFKIRVYGSPPTLGSCSYNSLPYEGDIVNFVQSVTEPDGDTVSYKWEQISPASPKGMFQDSTVKDPVWQAPPLYDVPETGVEFQIRVTAWDDDGQNNKIWFLRVKEKNSPPLCFGIETDPFYGVIQLWESMDLYVSTYDPDGDFYTIEWDMDWNGDPSDFDVQYTGSMVLDYQWYDQGFYKVGCRITEQRTNPFVVYCSRDVIQEGAGWDLKIDDSTETDPGYGDPDVFMLRDFSGNPVYHVAYRDSDDGVIYYCNTKTQPKMFLNHQVISPGPSSGYTLPPVIAGSEETIHVVWVETDTSSVPTQYYVKINTSVDGGMTFGAMGGERIVESQAGTNVIWAADICAGPEYGTFYTFHQDTLGGNYRCLIKVSYDGGNVWNYPSMGDGFRDVLTSGPCSDPRIKVSPDGTIHVLWRDYRGFNALYYDWSNDGGVTWHTDSRLSEYSVNPYNAKMAISDGNDVHLTWYDVDDKYQYFRKIYWDDPPYLGYETPIFSYGGDLYNGSDIWASPTGKTIFLPVMVESSGSYAILYYYSTSYGTWFRDYFYSFLGPNQASNIVCDGRWETNPNRAEILAAWIDDRTSFVTQYAHIWGQYVYLAERF